MNTFNDPASVSISGPHALLNGEQYQPNQSYVTRLLAPSGQPYGKSSWRQLLIAARDAYAKGYQKEGLRMYKEGLARADEALMHKHDELIRFLSDNIWNSKRR